MLLKILAMVRKMFSDEGNGVNYLSGAEALPKPYTPDEEQELVSMLSSGDEKIRQGLIEHNLRLVVYIARKFDNTGVETDDLISVGTIGLIKAVNTFNAGKNIKLATYASRCIENEILMHIRKISNQKTELSLDEPINTDWDGNELLLSDILGSDPDEVNRDLEQEAEKTLLLQCVERLEPRARQIMELRFGIGGRREHTQKEVADLMGISQSYISRLEKRIIKRLRKEISKMM